MIERLFYAQHLDDQRVAATACSWLLKAKKIQHIHWSTTYFFPLLHGGFHPCIVRVFIFNSYNRSLQPESPTSEVNPLVTDELSLVKC